MCEAYDFDVPSDIEHRSVSIEQLGALDILSKIDALVNEHAEYLCCFLHILE